VGFLTPIYIAGALAVALPVLFHLIRKMPRDRVPFSSLMFLSESPPRVTRRSRLENLALLLLRAAALCLLAFAFTRPFLRQPVQADSSTHAGRLSALLLDTSASMRRADLWPQAVAAVDRILADTSGADLIALYTFDRAARELVSFDDWLATPASARRAWLASRVSELSPAWGSTRLGSALTLAADALDGYSARLPAGHPAYDQRIILISDLQRGSHCRELDHYDWPDHVRVQVEQVKSHAATNAAIQWLGEPEELSDGASDQRQRVRVSNADDSAHGQFRIRWATDPGSAAEVYVAPGRSRLIRPPTPPAGSTVSQLLIEGDDHPFDNSLYIALPKRQTMDVLLIGNGAGDNPESPRFFLERAFADPWTRTVRLLSRNPDEPLLASDLSTVRLAVLTDPFGSESAQALRRFLQEGGTVLAMLSSAAMGESVGQMLGVESWQTPEAVVNDYAMLGEIDFAHPLFAPFADPRFGDFTKIHFWKYRRIDAGRPPGARVIARFDSGDPALIELRVEKGVVLLLASGWHSQDSQLAVSSKFVPLLWGVLEHAVGREPTALQYVIGDTVTLPELEGASYRVERPDATEAVVSEAAQGRFTDTALPGVYTVLSATTQFAFAVNLDPDESKTAPLAVEELEQLGVHLTGNRDLRKIEAIAASQRQMHAFELENRQKLWRWVLFVMLGVLIAETWLAGRLSRSSSAAL
jgi:hypothetical protein